MYDLKNKTVNIYRPFFPLHALIAELLRNLTVDEGNEFASSISTSGELWSAQLLIIKNKNKNKKGKIRKRKKKKCSVPKLRFGTAKFGK